MKVYSGRSQTGKTLPSSSSCGTRRRRRPSFSWGDDKKDGWAAGGVTATLGGAQQDEIRINIFFSVSHSNIQICAGYVNLQGDIILNLGVCVLTVPTTYVHDQILPNKWPDPEIRMKNVPKYSNARIFETILFGSATGDWRA